MSDPALWWMPVLGHWFHLRPADMAGLFVTQYVACMDTLAKQSQRRQA